MINFFYITKTNFYNRGIAKQYKLVTAPALYLLSSVVLQISMYSYATKDCLRFR